MSAHRRNLNFLAWFHVAFTAIDWGAADLRIGIARANGTGLRWAGNLCRAELSMGAHSSFHERRKFVDSCRFSNLVRVDQEMIWGSFRTSSENEDTFFSKCVTIELHNFRCVSKDSD